MEFEELRKEHLVFAYQTSPNYGIEGDDGGFSIELYGNGNLRYCTYKLFDEINSLEMFKLTREQVHQIFTVIQDCRTKLEGIPVYADDGKEHRNSNEFEFLGHGRIWTWDIHKTFLPMEIIKNRTYYREYKDNMKWENIVWDVFERICSHLKKCGILLTTDSCELSEDCKVRVTWK